MKDPGGSQGGQRYLPARLIANPHGVKECGPWCDQSATHPFDSAQGRLFAKDAKEWGTPGVDVPTRSKACATRLEEAVVS